MNVNSTVSRKKRVWLIIWSVLALLTGVGLLRLGYLSDSREGPARKDVRFGSRTLGWNFESGETIPSRFVHGVWNNDEDFSSGQFYQIQLPKGVLHLDWGDRPLERVRAAMPDSSTKLIELLRSKKPVEVFCAAEALATKGLDTESILPALLSAGAREQSVFIFISRMAKATPGAAVPLLAAALPTASEEIKIQIADLLAELGRDAASAAPVLLDEFRQADPSHQPGLAYALWRVGGDFSLTLPKLEKIVVEAGPALQSVLHVLSLFGAPRPPVLAAVLDLLRTNQNPAVLSAAVTVLERSSCDRETAVASLLTVLQHMKSANPGEAGIRQIVIRSLGQMDGPGLPILKEIYHGTNRMEAKCAADALVRILRNQPLGATVFTTDLDSTNTDRIVLACESIAQLGPRSDSPITKLMDMAQAHTRKVRVHAACALAKLSAFEPGLLPAVMDCLRDPYPTSSTAAELLHQITRTNCEMKAVFDQQLAQSEELERRYQFICRQFFDYPH